MITNKTINDITKHILSCNIVDSSCFELYNSWINASKPTIDDENEVMWLLDYINDIQAIKRCPETSKLLG